MALSTEEIRSKAKESKKHFAVGEFKEASRLLAEIRENEPDEKFVQLGDGTLCRVEKAEDGSFKTDPKTEEFVVQALA